MTSANMFSYVEFYAEFESESRSNLSFEMAELWPF